MKKNRQHKPSNYLMLWDSLDNFSNNAFGYPKGLSSIPDIIHGHYAEAGYMSSCITSRARSGQASTVEYKIMVNALKKLIALRKETTAFADFDNRQLLSLENPNLLAFSRTDPQNKRHKVLVIANFNVES